VLLIPASGMSWPGENMEFWAKKALGLLLVVLLSCPGLSLAVTSELSNSRPCCAPKCGECGEMGCCSQGSNQNMPVTPAPSRIAYRGEMLGMPSLVSFKTPDLSFENLFFSYSYRELPLMGDISVFVRNCSLLL